MKFLQSFWRPFIGLICGLGLCYHLLVYPVLIAFVPGILPLDLMTLGTLISILLGLGGLRTFEKTKGVTSNDR